MENQLYIIFSSWLVLTIALILYTIKLKSDVSPKYKYRIVNLVDRGTLVWLYGRNVPVFSKYSWRYYDKYYSKQHRLQTLEFVTKEQAIEYLLKTITWVTLKDIDPKIYGMSSVEFMRLRINLEEEY